MAEDFLEEVYREAAAVTELKTLIGQLWGGSMPGYMMMELKRLLNVLGDVSKKLAEKNEAAGTELWNVLEQLIRCSDNMQRGDILEAKVLPLLQDYLKQIPKIEVDDEEGHLLVSSERVFLTVQDTLTGEYYHSTTDPMQEALEIAKRIYRPEIRAYSLLGCGLGYVAYQLYCMSEGSARLRVFEPERKMVDYAGLYGVLDWIPTECIEIVVSGDVMDFLNSVTQEDEEYYILPAVISKFPKDIAALIRELAIQQNTNRAVADLMKLNLYHNIKSVPNLISDFRATELPKQYIIVAAGPSLDESMDFLRGQKGKKTIIAVGTVYKKLIASHIIPDIVTVLDPQVFTLKQLEGAEDMSVPLLLAMTAYWKLARVYKGEKYLIPLRSNLREEQEYAEKSGEKVWQCGTTVTSLAFQIAVQFGAKEIYLAGADFAYPNGMSHAEGTAERKEMRKGRDLFQVESVDGKMVDTDAVLSLYRREMETDIAEHPEITCYNLSRTGAKIAGARVPGQDLATGE